MKQRCDSLLRARGATALLAILLLLLKLQLFMSMQVSTHSAAKAKLAPYGTPVQSTRSSAIIPSEAHTSLHPVSFVVTRNLQEISVAV